MKIELHYVAEKHDTKVFRLKMKEKGFTFRSLAKEMGISHAYAYDLVNGRSAFNEKQYRLINDLLGE